MRNQIVENKQFYIISRSIDNAEMCKVTEVCEDCFKVKLSTPRKYEIDESIELFTMTDKGQLYFETIVKNIDNDIISIWFPITYKYLQRREFSRVNLNKDIILTDKNNNLIDAIILDISAGGLKISTIQQLELLKEYKVSFTIENQEVNTVFEPIRIETSGKSFISSGRFKEISNYDRIALVQYCFRKQIEISSK
ncbi:PilZ domain-containing protein [bacterium]|nr:PilZ domain-containing protein [bacterium]